MQKLDKFQLPTVFVIFGVTGDLVRAKILISLYHLFIKGLLPRMFQVVGFSRRDWNDEDLHKYLKDILEAHDHSPYIDDFLKRFFYIKGDFEDTNSYQILSKKLGRVDGEWKVCSNKLFYLAVPPSSYKTILINLKDSGLTIPCSPTEGWTRVILEKPFGSNLQTAQELDVMLGKLFKEEQIYRVDHYLGKETVRNILAFRFANSFLTQAWNNQSIDHINITFKEKDTVSSRGEFYDSVGALRDVGQNHILQVLALFMMDNPGELTMETIRSKRVEVLSKIRLLNPEEIKSQTSHGQYEGYKQEKGVNPQSNTETYFKIRLFVDDEHWLQVPVTLEFGKALDHEEMMVEVVFKDVGEMGAVFDGSHSQNILRYHIQPEEKIIFSFLVKKPGHQNELKEKNFEFDYKKEFSDGEFVDAYEKLILDMIKGDQTLFVSTEEVVAEWKFVEPILKEWEQDMPALFTYKPFEPIEKELEKTEYPKIIGIIGLGKMGGNMAKHLLSKDWEVYGYNRTIEKAKEFPQTNFHFYSDYKTMISEMKSPRTIILSLPAGTLIDEVLFGENGITDLLNKNDTILDFGNSYYVDSQKRAEKLKMLGIDFMDVGISGGPAGALNGACLMIGGKRESYEKQLPLFVDLGLPLGVAFFQGAGAGHYVKMVHNGIEYGMMQSIAEGFTILKNSDYNLDLQEVARIYNTGSVIESRLIDWLHKGYELFGNDLSDISGEVGFTGEGEWTIQEAKKKNISVRVIEEAFEFRKKSQGSASYTGQLVSLLRYMFGGHNVKKDETK